MVCHLDVIDLVVFMVVLGLTGGSRFARVWVGLMWGHPPPTLVPMIE